MAVLHGREVWVTVFKSDEFSVVIIIIIIIIFEWEERGERREKKEDVKRNIGKHDRAWEFLKLNGANKESDALGVLWRWGMPCGHVVVIIGGYQRDYGLSLCG